MSEAQANSAVRESEEEKVTNAMDSTSEDESQTANNAGTSTIIEGWRLSALMAVLMMSIICVAIDNTSWST